MTADPEVADEGRLLLPGRWRGVVFWVLVISAIASLAAMGLNALGVRPVSLGPAEVRGLLAAAALTGAAVSWFGGLTVRTPVRPGWLQMAVACSLFAVVIVWGPELGLMGSVLVALGYLIMSSAASVVIRERKMALGRAQALDALIFCVGSLSAILQLLGFERSIKLGTVDAQGLGLIALLSLMAAAVLVGLQVVWITGDQPRPKAVITACLGMVLIVFGHLLGFWESAEKAVATASPPKSLVYPSHWLIVTAAGIVFFAAASIHSSAAFAARRESEQEHTGWLISFYVIALVAPLLSHLFADRRAPVGDDQNWTLVISLMLLAFLFPWRILLLIEAQEKLRTEKNRELFEAEERLRVERQLALFLQDATDAVMRLDASGLITYATPASAALGAPPDRATGSAWLELFDAADQPQAAALLKDPESGARGAQIIRMPGPQGRWLYVEISAKPYEDGFIVTHHDVTQEYLLRSKLERDATTDPLTGLLNRRGLLDQLIASMKRAARGTSDPPSLLLIDLDNFKEVNDTLGHLAGDQLLMEVARRMTDSLRDIDVAARFGGDEFAVLIENAQGRRDAAVVGYRLIDAVTRPVDIDDAQAVVGASIGIAHASAEIREPDELLRRADLALYRSKDRGKGTVTTFHPYMLEEVISRSETMESLRRALLDGEIVPAVSPILSLDGKSLRALSCSAGWADPDQGWIPREQWAGLAEDLKLTSSIDDLVLSTSIRHGATWLEEHPSEDLLVIVAVGSGLLLRPSFPTQMADLLAAHGISPTNLLLEVGQETLRRSTSHGQIRELREIGIGVLLADTEPSLSTLSTSPGLVVSGLSVTVRPLVAPKDPTGPAVIRAIRDIAASLGVNPVVADHVDDDQVRDAVAALGYEWGRGEALAPAMRVDEVPLFLAEAAAPAP